MAIAEEINLEELIQDEDCLYTVEYLKENSPELLEDYIDLMEKIKWPIIRGSFHFSCNFRSENKTKIEKLKKSSDDLVSIVSFLEEFNPKLAERFGSSLMSRSIYNTDEDISEMYNYLNENLELLGKTFDKLEHYVFDRSIGILDFLPSNPEVFKECLEAVNENAERMKNMYDKALKFKSYRGHMRRFNDYIFSNSLYKLVEPNLDKEFFTDYLNFFEKLIDEGHVGYKKLIGIAGKILKRRNNKSDSSLRLNKANNLFEYSKEFDGGIGKYLFLDNMVYFFENDDKFNEEIYTKLKEITPYLDKVESQLNNIDNASILRNLKLNLPKGVAGLGKYSKDFFENIRSNFSIYKLSKMNKSFNENNEKYDFLRDKLDNTNLEVSSNKKVNKMFKLIDFLSISHELNLGLNEWDNLELTNFNEAKNYVVDEIKNEIGQDVEIKDLFNLESYLKYLNQENNNENDNFSEFLNDVLKKEMPNGYEYNLPNLEVPIKFERKVDLEKLSSEINKYVNLFEELTGEKIELKDDEDLEYYKKVSEDTYQKIKDWKRTNAEEAKLKSGIVKEIEPNLERITNMKEVEISEGKICFEPYNFKDQMMALDKIRSCLSPGGCNFHYTRHYLTNVPDFFFATIKKDNGYIVGRSAIAVGMDSETDEKCVARVSNIYTHIPVLEEDMDNAVKAYANKLQGEFTKEDGKVLKVEGIGDKVYDDRIRPAEEIDSILLNY